MSRMNRRVITQAMGGLGLAIPFIGVRSSRVLGQEATPSPEAGLEEVELADGLFLVDYRFGIAYGTVEDAPMLFAEVENRTNNPENTPRLLMVFLDNDENIVGEESVWPVVNFVPANGRAPVRAEFYEFNPMVEAWSTVRFELDSEWPSPFGATFYAPTLEVTDVEEEAGDDSWIGRGNVLNTGTEPEEFVEVTAIFRDHNGRYAGYGWDRAQSTIPPGKKWRFTIDVGVNTVNAADPFQFIEDGEYTVEIVVGYAS